MKMDESINLEMYEKSPDAVILVSDQGNILWYNSSFNTIFGYNSPELIGQKIEILLQENLHQVHKQNRDEYFIRPTERAMGRGLKMIGIRKNRQAFRVEVSLKPIQTANGYQVFCTISDLSAYLKIK